MCELHEGVGVFGGMVGSGVCELGGRRILRIPGVCQSLELYVVAASGASTIQLHSVQLAVLRPRSRTIGGSSVQRQLHRAQCNEVSGAEYRAWMGQS